MISIKNKKGIILTVAICFVLVVTTVVLINVLNNKDTYDVTFYSDTGVVLKVDVVQKHLSATPPNSPKITYGKVFKSWDTDFSDVTNDLDVYPVCEDVKGKTNVIAAQSVYSAKENTLTVPIQLCGNVCVSGLDITIYYDKNSLQLKSVTEDGSVIYNDSTPGVVNLNYVSTENTTADVDLCNLQFLTGTSEGELPITIEVKSIYAFEDESKMDEMYIPDFTVINGAVYVN